MERIALVTAVLLQLFSSPVSAQVMGLEKGRQDLKQIQNKVQERQKELSQYRKKEQDINRYISFLKKQEDSAKKLKQKLALEKAKTERNLTDSERKHTALELGAKQWSEILSAEAYHYVLMLNSAMPYYDSRGLVSQLFSEAAIYQKISILEKMRGETARTGQMMKTLRQNSKDIISKSVALESENKKRQQRYQEKLTDLSQTREKYQKTLRELEELQNSAKSLTSFLQKFEKSKTYSKAGRSSRLLIARNSLSWPAQGRVVSYFGKEAIPSLRTWIVREGIKIAVPLNNPVSSASGGKVIYAGVFRSYGKVVIVDHEKGFFTVYGFLDQIAVRKGSVVDTGTTLGYAGTDTQGSYSIEGGRGNGMIYFEVRTGTGALNPLDWLAR